MRHERIIAECTLLTYRVGRTDGAKLLREPIDDTLFVKIFNFKHLCHLPKSFPFKCVWLGIGFMKKKGMRTKEKNINHRSGIDSVADDNF